MNWFPVIAILFQVTLVAALGLLAASRLRSAAHRHSILVASMLCILASPLFFAGTQWSGFSVRVPFVFSSQVQKPLASGLKEPDFRPAPAPPEVAPAPLNGLQAPAERTPDQSVAVLESPPVSEPDVAAFRMDLLIGPLWLGGTLFCLAGILRSHWKTRVTLQSVRPLDTADYGDAIAGAAKQLGLRRFPRAGTTGRVAGPAVAGILRPWILIPARYLETLSPDELRQVLVHEGAHALRRDPLFALLQRLCTALYWWHPLVHLLNRQLWRAREEVCDNFVLRQVAPETYGSTLLRLARLSPGMASVPAAIGMLDSRWKLEDRIRGLLDERRKVRTRVRLLTATAVLGGFAAFSTLAAGARIDTQNPIDSSAPVSPETPPQEQAPFRPVAAITAAGDDDYRTLHDQYKALILAAARAGKKDEVSRLTDQFNESLGNKLLFVQITLRSGPIADHEPVFSKFFNISRGITIGKLGFAIGQKPIVSQNHDGQGVVLIATNPLEGQKWPDDLQVTLVLDNVARENIRKPPAGPSWGDAKDGLRARLSAAKRTFRAGEAIPVKVEIENVSDEAREYKKQGLPDNGTLVVSDERGRNLPWLGGLSQVRWVTQKLGAGQLRELHAFDLAVYYHLRQPGRYSIRFPGEPPSAAFEFDVTAGPAPDPADGDPVGRLLPLIRDHWWLGAGSSKPARLRPGGNRAEVTGRFIYFQYNPTGNKNDAGLVSLWLADEVAVWQPPAGDSPPSSEYLGRIDRWHVYIHVDANAGKAWPAVVEDIKRSLAAAPGSNAASSENAAALEQIITALEVQRAELLLRYKEEHPKVKELGERIRQLEAKRKTATPNTPPAK